MFFLIKKPTNLLFIRENFAQEMLVPNSEQVRVRDGATNAKLVKCADGSWHIRVGGWTTRLSGTASKPTRVALLAGGAGRMLAALDTKYFIDKH